MSERKYTADELRAEAKFHAFRNGDSYIVVEMLRQAADAEDELAKLKAQNVTIRTDNSAVIAELHRRLEAVVKECNMLLTDCGCNVREFHVDYVRKYADAILRAARGEGGAE